MPLYDVLSMALFDSEIIVVGGRSKWDTTYSICEIGYSIGLQKSGLTTLTVYSQ